MKLIAVFQLLQGAMNILMSLSQQAQTANGARLQALLQGIEALTQQMQNISSMIRRGVEEGREELTEEEKTTIRQADDAMKAAQLRALGEENDEGAQDASEAEKQAESNLKGAHRAARKRGKQGR